MVRLAQQDRIAVPGRLERMGGVLVAANSWPRRRITALRPEVAKSTAARISRTRGRKAWLRTFSARSSLIQSEPLSG